MTKKQRKEIAQIADDALYAFGGGIKAFTADGIYRLEYKPDELDAIRRALNTLEAIALGHAVPA